MQIGDRHSHLPCNVILKPQPGFRSSSPHAYVCTRTCQPVAQAIADQEALLCGLTDVLLVQARVPLSDDSFRERVRVLALRQAAEVAVGAKHLHAEGRELAVGEARCA